MHQLTATAGEGKQLSTVTFAKRRYDGWFFFCISIYPILLFINMSSIIITLYNNVLLF